jgi:hypothetical protein
VRTAAVAALIAVAVAATGFGLQAAGLRRTPRANIVAADAANWLLRYRFAASTVRVGGRTVHGRCFHGWFEARNEHRAHGTILMLDNGASVQAVDPTALDAHDRRPLVPVSELELAGCTHILGLRVAGLAQFDGNIRLARTWVSGVPALALHFTRLTLLVAAKTDRPIGVELGRATSTIRLAPVGPQLERALGTLE